MVSLLVFHRQQQALLLEGNDLLSGDAVLVKNADRPLSQVISALGPHARLITVPDAEGVRYIHAADVTRVPLPIYSGRGFKAGETAAVVGAGVSTEPAKPTGPFAGAETIALDGNRYPVVGRLGGSSASLLSTTVLVQDSAALARRGGASVYIDAPEAVRRVPELLPNAQVEKVQPGVAQRTSVDFFSPVVFTLGIVVIGLGWMSAGVQWSLSRREHYRFDRLLGRTRLTCLCRLFALPLTLAAAAVLSAYAVSRAVFAVAVPTLHAGAVAAALMVFMAVAVIVPTRWGERNVL